VHKLAKTLLLLSLSAGLHAADCTPHFLAVVFTTDLSSVVAGFPVAISVRVADDCGNPVTKGSVTALFANGDPPLQMTSLGNGLWVATYTFHQDPAIPTGSTSPFRITVTAITPNPLLVQPDLVGSTSVTGVVIQRAFIEVLGTDNIPPAVAGGEPVRQKVTIVSGSAHAPFQVTTAIVAGRTDALFIEPSSGFTPATIDLVFAPPVDVAGNVQVQAILQIGDTYTLPFPLIVLPPPAPALSISKDRLLFSYIGVQSPRSQILAVGNVSGLPLNFTVASATSSGGSWLSVDVNNGVTTYRKPASISITADPTGLAAGTYSGVVRVSADDGTHSDVTVTMSVKDAQPSILLSQFGATFNAIENGATEPPQAFTILNGGQGTLTWNVSIQNQPSWLQVSPASGQSVSGSQDNPQVMITADATGLSAGRYYALVQIDGDGANDGPQYLTVVLNVSPNSGQPVIYIRPSGVIATAPAGTSSVTLPSINIYDLSGGTVTYTSAAATFDSGQWLFYDPSDVSGHTSPVRIDLVAKSAQLAAGVHRAAITLQLPDGTTRVLSVLLQLTPPPVPPGTGQQASADCNANAVTIQYTSATGYTVVGGWPTTLEVQAFDNCNQPFTSGSIAASFSTGEPPLSLRHIQNGVWNQTWTPRQGTLPFVRVQFRAQDLARGLDTTLPYPIELPKTDYDPPELETGGIIDPVSLVAGLLAPGSLFTANGQRLASSSSSATAPYPFNLSDASIIIHGESIPLSSASITSLTGMLPFDLPANSSIPVVISRGNTFSTPVLLTIASAAPSLYSTDGTGSGQGIVYHAAQPATLADVSNPASIGEQLIVECTGLGAVTPAVDPGTVAPDGASVNAKVQVTVGGIPAFVAFAQMKSGSVGVYQVQVTVPDGVSPSDAAPVQIQIAERLSNTTTISVH
jgi:uncharacterized protein (TIGR03437 family)